MHRRNWQAALCFEAIAATVGYRCPSNLTVQSQVAEYNYIESVTRPDSCVHCRSTLQNVVSLPAIKQWHLPLLCHDSLDFQPKRATNKRYVTQRVKFEKRLTLSVPSS